jgi:hypothetical protein
MRSFKCFEAGLELILRSPFDSLRYCSISAGQRLPAETPVRQTCAPALRRERAQILPSAWSERIAIHMASPRNVKSDAYGEFSDTARPTRGESAGSEESMLRSVSGVIRVLKTGGMFRVK